MPADVSADYKTALALGSPALAKCLSITRVDGGIIRLTDFQRDIIMSASLLQELSEGTVTFNSWGVTFTDLATSSQISSPDNWEIKAVVDETIITSEHIKAGLYQNATVWLYLPIWTNLTLKPRKSKYFIGDVVLNGEEVTFRLRSLAQPFQQQILERTSGTCRARRLGDERCRFNMAGNTVDGFAARVTSTVTSVGSDARRVFVVSATAGFPDDRFANGVVDFSSGANNLNGWLFETETFDSATGTFTLRFATPFDIVAGVGVILDVGCDRRIETCHDVFNNVINFVGEPGIKGTAANHELVPS